MPNTIKRDDVKQAWQQDEEFPLVCETCLGDNPYVRMTKQAFGKACRVCETPFTVFAWQAGTKGRLKRVEICQSCARAKNVCQVCLYDLQYGLPVAVRDQILRESGSATAVAAVPQSQANRAYYTQQQERLLAQGTNNVAAPNATATAQLAALAQMEPRYERNLPKLCSFYARGECNRGATCPFRHELPKEDRNAPLGVVGKQNTKDRFYGTSSDIVAQRILGRKRKQEQLQQAAAGAEYNRARSTLYLRFQGDAPYPPLTEPAVRDVFYSFGEIASVRVQPDKGQAFVEYTQPQATELAIAQTNRTATLLGRTLLVAWARAPKRGDVSVNSSQTRTSNSANTNSNHSNTPRCVVVPPPPSDRKTAPPNPKMAKTAIKLPPEVLAAARRKRQGVATGSSVPKYPSANPNRLGTTSELVGGP